MNIQLPRKWGHEAGGEGPDRKICSRSYPGWRDFVYIDAGTTTGDMLKFLKVTRAVFVTNAVVHAQTLAGRGFKVLLVGGEAEEHYRSSNW